MAGGMDTTATTMDATAKAVILAGTGVLTYCLMVYPTDSLPGYNSARSVHQTCLIRLMTRISTDCPRRPWDSWIASPPRPKAATGNCAGTLGTLPQPERSKPALGGGDARKAAPEGAPHRRFDAYSTQRVRTTGSHHSQPDAATKSSCRLHHQSASRDELKEHTAHTGMRSDRNPNARSPERRRLNHSQKERLVARKINVALVDDLDGSQATETVQFSLDGVRYEIDLSTVNATRMRSSLAEFVAVARRVRGRRSTAPTTAGSRSRPNSRDNERPSNRPNRRLSHAEGRAIRDWAARQGINLKNLGRLPNDIIDAYYRQKIGTE